MVEEAPVLNALRVDGNTAVLSARPNAKPWGLAVVVSFAGTVSCVAMRLWMGGDLWPVLAVLFACTTVFVGGAWVVALRAGYWLTLDFAARTIEVVETLGLDPPTRWSGGFDDIETIYAERQGDGLTFELWWPGEPKADIRAIVVSAPESDRERFLEQVRFSFGRS